MRLLGRVFAAAAMVVTLTAPGAAADSWWDGGYDDTWDEPLAPAEVGPLYGCENSTLPGDGLVLHKTTSPPPDTPVRPGDDILVEITWEVFDWTGPEDLQKAIDCVYVDGLLAPGLSGGERPTPNDGHFAWHYVVPFDVPPGATICDQGFVSGPDGWEENGRAVSNVVCFPVVVPPPPAPECCTAPPPPPPAPAPPETTTTTTAAPAATTTTTPPEEDEEEPYVESVRLEQQAPPAEVLPAQREVLPRTGGDGAPARLAAAALAVAALAGTRRRWGGGR